MADLDLATALGMFKDGINSLALTNAINSANDQVTQIKSSVANEQQQRAQMQQVSNNLVAHMATFGTPATTMQAVAGAIGPKQYANAAAMNQDALLTGNKGLGDIASNQQDFENNPKFELAKIKAQAKYNPLSQLQFQEKQDEFNTKQLGAFGKELDSSAASSHTSFGKWQSVVDSGSRMGALLGDPSKWQNMTPQQLALTADQLGNMVKGSALTEGDQKTLHAASAKLAVANQVAWASGKPVSVDLSDWAKLYSNLKDNEDQNAKSQLVDDLVQKVQNRAALYNRAPSDFKQTVAGAFRNKGIPVTANDVTMDEDKKIKINGVTDSLDAASSAAQHVKQALHDANGGDSVARAQALKFLGAFGVSPTMGTKEAVQTVQRKIKARIFSQ